MNKGQIASLSWSAIALMILGGCERAEKKVQTGQENSNLKQLQDALPGALVVPSDPEQLKKLGPSAVPGILPEAEVTMFRRRALSGDGKAAYQLYHHYNLTGNESEAQVWVRIGAENGEYNSMMLMGFESEQTSGVDDCVRAVYWFTRARRELEADLNTADASSNRGDVEALITAATEEIASVRRRTAGC